MPASVAWFIRLLEHDVMRALPVQIIVADRKPSLPTTYDDRLDVILIIDYPFRRSVKEGVPKHKPLGYRSLAAASPCLQTLRQHDH